MTVEDGQALAQLAIQINMDLESMVFPTDDGQRFIKELDDSNCGEVGYAPHNISHILTMRLNTCRDKHGAFTW